MRDQEKDSKDSYARRGRWSKLGQSFAAFVISNDKTLEEVVDDETRNEIQSELEERAENMSEERVQLAFERACRRAGTDDIDDPELEDAFQAVMSEMIWADILKDMKDEGVVRSEVHPESGELRYWLTDKGKAIAEQEKKARDDRA